MPALAAQESARAMRSHALSMEVALRERLSAMGVPDTAGYGTQKGDAANTGKPSLPRIVCHLEILDELLKQKSFGAYHNLMKSIVSELKLGLFTDSEQGATIVQDGRYALTHEPYFVAYEKLESSLRSERADGETLRGELASGLQELRSKDLDHDARAQTLKRTENAYVITKEQESMLREEVRALRQKLSKEEAQRREDNLKLQADVAYWRRTAQSAASEKVKMEQRSVDEAHLRKAFDSDVSNGVAYDLSDAHAIEQGDAHALIEQLQLLQGTRIDEYEMSYETTPAPHLPTLREAFVKEMGMVHAELIALQRYIVENERNLQARVEREKANEFPHITQAQEGDRFVARFLSGPVGANTASAAVEVEEEEEYILGDRMLIPPTATHVQFVPAQHDTPPAPLTSSATPTPSTAAQAQRDDAAGLLLNESMLDEGHALVKSAGRGLSAGVAAASPSPDDSRRPQAEPGSDASKLLEQLNTMEEEARSKDLASLGIDNVRIVAARWPAPKRSVTLKALVSRIEKVFAEKLAAEAENPQERRVSLREFFYRHLMQMYGSEAVVLIVARATLESLDVHAKASATVALFLKSLAGSTHDSVWHYHNWFRRVLAVHPIRTHRDFGVLLETLYPAYRDLEAPAFVADYASAFPEASSSSALEFLTGQLLLRTEPRLRKWMKILKWKDVHNRGSFHHNEFSEIALKLFPGTTRKQIDAWFETTSNYEDASGPSMTHSAPLSVLVSIACCLDIQID
ncbi:hypothetical protein RI054_03g15710 [Pseudoscourfieldia marina]